MTQINDQIGNKMKVEIWSDVMCPFCYIGKRKFEMALDQFPHRDRIAVEWKSFQLMPELQAGTTHDLETILVETKGMDLGQVKAMNQQVANAGEQVGINFNFEKSIAVNTQTAHRFVHFAKDFGKQNEAEELLFRAYFTDGKNVEDHSTLIALGKEIGLDSEKLKIALEREHYSEQVQSDIQEARELGVRGVPFFVMDRTYAVSGAQDPRAFLQTLEKSFTEWEKTQMGPDLKIVEGSVCEPGKACD